MAEFDGDWFGLKPDGSKVRISHLRLMRWAHDHDATYQVGWSYTYKDPNGVRLARTSAAARERGWNDLADLMDVEKVEGLVTVEDPDYRRYGK